ncbi:MAG TPA: butyrate kinase [Terriglobales bacterium]|nr:butyrate kinase [Terriglobales bacterium]
MADNFDVLVINPGSTSTKFAVYRDAEPLFVVNLRHSAEELAPFRGRPILDQQEFRRQKIEEELTKRDYRTTQLKVVVGRGGLLRPLASGTYRVNDEMLAELRRAERGEHASNLGAFLATSIAEGAGAPAFIVDPVSVDEWPEKARLSGYVLLDRECLSHALNSKAVAKRFARECGRPYDHLHLIVAHVGSGISVSAHEHGRMVDVTNSREEGAFSTERAGTVPCMKLVDLCFSGKYTRQQVETMLFREGGLYSYLGTKDLEEIESRIAAGDSGAALVYDAMIYQIAKEIGAMAAAIRGRVDAILLTGGMAHSKKLVANLRSHIYWIAPLKVYPGEDELQALAEGALRVLRGEEKSLEFGTVSTPRLCSS